MRYGGYTGHHKLYVVRGKGPHLLGCNWLQHIRLEWASVQLMSANSSSQAVEEMTRKYPEVFQEGLDTMKHVRAHLSLREGANPYVFAALAQYHLQSRKQPVENWTGWKQQASCGKWITVIGQLP